MCDGGGVTVWGEVWDTSEGRAMICRCEVFGALPELCVVALFGAALTCHKGLQGIIASMSVCGGGGGGWRSE